MPGVVKGPSQWCDLRVVPGLHAGKSPDRAGGVGGLADGVDTGLELLLFIEVRNEGEQQLGAVGKCRYSACREMPTARASADMVGGLPCSSVSSRAASRIRTRVLDT